MLGNLGKFNIIFFILMTLLLMLFIYRSECKDTNNSKDMPFSTINIGKGNFNDIFNRELEKLKDRTIWRRIFITTYFICLTLFVVMSFMKMGGFSFGCDIINLPWLIIFIIIYFVIYQITNFFIKHDSEFIYNNMKLLASKKDS